MSVQVPSFLDQAEGDRKVFLAGAGGNFNVRLPSQEHWLVLRD